MIRTMDKSINEKFVVSLQPEKLKKKMRKIVVLLMAALIVAGCNHPVEPEKAEVPVVAYVCSWTPEMPDGKYVTQINYAFGNVNETFDGLTIQHPERLRAICALRQSPEAHKGLKVLLSIGGWTAGRFSEMAADSLKRLSFAADCKRAVDEYDLDGIDMDWEYPTSSEAGISSSPDDTKNYTLLMRDIRAAIGPDKLLTQATICTAQYIDFAAVDPYVDFTNIMTYDMGRPPYHNTPLYDSPLVKAVTVDSAVRAHLAAGIPPEKLFLGLAFYGHGVAGIPSAADLTQVCNWEGYTYHWDEQAMVPYMTDDRDGSYAFGYEDLRSLTLKCQYILEKGLHGAMYWSWDGDNEAGDLRRTVYTVLNGE